MEDFDMNEDEIRGRIRTLEIKIRFIDEDLDTLAFYKMCLGDSDTVIEGVYDPKTYEKQLAELTEKYKGYKLDIAKLEREIEEIHAREKEADRQYRIYEDMVCLGMNLLILESAATIDPKTTSYSVNSHIQSQKSRVLAENESIIRRLHV